LLIGKAVYWYYQLRHLCHISRRVVKGKIGGEKSEVALLLFSAKEQACGPEGRALHGKNIGG
jgi:hypothetical protein